MNTFYQENPHGSSRFGGLAQAQSLRLGSGPEVAVLDKSILHAIGDQPRVTFGGAGSSKFTALGAYQALSPAVGSIFILDVGGQYANITWHWNIALGREAYAINPRRIGVHTHNHALNVVSILKVDEFLFSDAWLVANMLAPERPHAGSNSWVRDEQVRWLSALLLYLTLKHGYVTLPMLWELINRIDSDDDAFMGVGREAEDMPFDLYATFLEIYRKKKTSEKEYGAVMGTIKSDLAWLGDPNMSSLLDTQEDYLQHLADPDKKVAIYLKVPPEMTSAWTSFVRVVVGTAMLHCQRAGRGGKPLFYLDEASTCGGAQFIKQAVSLNRKFHSTSLAYQSYGQVVHHFGSSGAQEILSSCGIQQYMGGGIRDLATANMLADSIGHATIAVDDPLTRADRAYRAQSALREMLTDAVDPMEAMLRLRHETLQSRQQKKMRRYLIDAAEILRLGQDQQILLCPGLGVPPLLCDKLPPYWTNPAMAGKYAPDPLFPPTDRVRVQLRFRRPWRRLIRQTPPKHLAHLPNVSTGEITFVEGFRTW